MDVQSPQMLQNKEYFGCTLSIIKLLYMTVYDLYISFLSWCEGRTYFNQFHQKNNFESSVISGKCRNI